MIFQFPLLLKFGRVKEFLVQGHGCGKQFAVIICTVIFADQQKSVQDTDTGASLVRYFECQIPKKYEGYWSISPKLFMLTFWTLASAEILGKANDLSVSSMCRGHVNLVRIVPILKVAIIRVLPLENRTGLMLDPNQVVGFESCCCELQFSLSISFLLVPYFKGTVRSFFGLAWFNLLSNGQEYVQFYDSVTSVGEFHGLGGCSNLINR